mmetsp:Transcript_11184/g.22453  ORF Transcript_11184/g.22453 Transcript_11184/m.22453 type:complete len:216 (-) Transcript_11184:156-803(-)
MPYMMARSGAHTHAACDGEVGRSHMPRMARSGWPLTPTLTVMPVWKPLWAPSGWTRVRGVRGVDCAEPEREVVLGGPEFTCARKAEPERGVERGLSTELSWWRGRVLGSVSGGTGCCCSCGLRTSLGGELPMRTLRGCSSPPAPRHPCSPIATPCGLSWLHMGERFVGSGLGGRSGGEERWVASSSARRERALMVPRAHMVRERISAVAGELMPS